MYSYAGATESGVLVARGDLVELKANGSVIGSPSEVVPADGHLELRVGKPDLEALGDVNSVTFVYHIIDRAGNRSQGSAPKTVQIVLTG